MLDSILSILRGQAAPAAQAQPAAPPSAAERIETDPEMPGLPDNARPIIRKINALMLHIEQLVEGDPLAIPLVVEMRQMNQIHLPRLTRSYVEIPEAHRREVYARTGKSASYHLCQSLGAMEARLVEIDRALAQQQISNFEANTSTIDDIYRRPDDNPLA